MFAAREVIQLVAEVAIVGSGQQIQGHAHECDTCNRGVTVGEKVPVWSGR
jgi:hypothetical protein